MLTWSRVEKLLKMCKTPASGAQTPAKTEIAAFFAIELSIRAAIVAAYKRLGTPVNREKQYVSRQSSSAGRRKGTAQGPGGIQASDRRALWHGVLHHQPRRQSCGDLSSGRVAPNRGEAGQAVQLQSFEKEISERFQEVCSALSAHHTVVQIGSRKDPRLEGARDLRGQTTLRESAAIKGDVAVYGNLTYLEVRSMEVSKQLAEEQFTAEDEKTLDELGI